MKKQLTTVLAVLSTAAFMHTASAQDTLFDAGFLSVSGQVEMDSLISENSSNEVIDDLNMRATVTLSARITDNIRAVVTAELRQALRENGMDSSNLGSFDIEEFVKEAYIEVRVLDGKPLAFIVGKHEIAFGQNFSAMPLNDQGSSSAIGSLTRQDQVMGITMALDHDFFGLIDRAEVSIFETEAGDLDIGRMDNVSVRLSRDIGRNLRVNGSYMNRNDGANGDREHRGALGLVYSSGDWTAYVEGVGMIDNAEYPDANFATTLGTSYDVGFGVVAVEYSYIQQSLHKFGLGFEARVTDSITIGPEISYSMDENGENGSVSGGVRVTLKPKDEDQRRKRD